MEPATVSTLDEDVVLESLMVRFKPDEAPAVRVVVVAHGMGSGAYGALRATGRHVIRFNTIFAKMFNKFFRCTTIISTLPVGLS